MYVERKFEIEAGGSTDFAPCDCCGDPSRTVWGMITEHELYIAAYYVHWTRSRPDHGAHFDLVLGPWGGDIHLAARVCVSVVFHVTETGAAFTVVNADQRPAAELAARALSREEVVGTTYAEEAFALIDSILERDPRVSELLGKDCGCCLHARRRRLRTPGLKRRKKRIAMYREQRH